MQRPSIRLHMSTGAWVFATGVAVSIISSAGVYAAVNSIVAIGNSSGTTTAYVTPTRQLQTTTIASANVVHAAAAIGAASCGTVYTPPAGKAIVVTQITYDIGAGTQGSEDYAILESGCNTIYDYADTVQAFEEKSHTFPTGLPMPDVSVHNSTSTSYPVYVAVTGYLIPVSQLPPEPPQIHGRMKGMPRGG